MNRHQLLVRLDEAGVSNRFYGISTRDLSTFDHLLEAVPVLVEGADGRWSIDVWERGERRVKASFDSEEEACSHLCADVMRQWEIYRSR
ncbi:hypothetical protein ACIOGZ_41210 [Kitasatospora sp. NPDC088160]|uniref:hypothetical protein n=1 Tax=Kitasatospora sp. NPDC088160 TaxID=3364072 RepID=UPI00380E4CF1